MKLIKRKHYLETLIDLVGTPDIKVITGIRRAGKSKLLESLRDYLKESFTGANIIHVNYNLDEFEDLTEYHALLDYVKERYKPEAENFLLVDEIQMCEGFERAINSLHASERYDIFITGSNSYLLSGELMTKLTGRYIEFEMQTLTFKEYEDMKVFLGKSVNPNPVVELDAYILEGGFPKALGYEALVDKRAYVKSVVEEILEKDVRRRVQVRNMPVFETVRKYITNNFGATTSLTNILDDLAKQGVHIKRETLDRYLRILEDAKIIRRCERFDMKSRRSLRGEQKYYLADLSFYFALNTDNRINYGPVLENIVYSYARSLGYEVSVGRIGKLECDFVMRSPAMEYAYVQVAMTIMNSLSTEDREYRPLEQIRDNWPKFVITRNDPIQHRSGIVHENVTDLIAEGRTFGMAQRSALAETECKGVAFA